LNCRTGLEFSVKIAADGVAVNVTVADAPGARVPRAHSAATPTWTKASHLPCVVVIEGEANAVRSAKPRRTTLVAELGPLLVTTAVIAIGWPSSIAAELLLTRTARSASAGRATVIVTAYDVLSSGTTSSGVETTAALYRFAVSPGAMPVWTLVATKNRTVPLAGTTAPSTQVTT
jgi:hypothetical protein